MVKRKTKSKKRKTKKTKSKTAKQRSDLDKLKEAHDSLTIRVQQGLTSIMQNTGMNKDQLGLFIKNNSWEALKKLPNLKISEPILDQMIKLFKQYDKTAHIIQRLEVAENKLFLKNLELKTQEMEQRVADIEKQDSFYTELPDKEGFVQMKQKYHAEKEFWEGEKAKALEVLEQNAEHPQGLAGLEEANRELKILSKKKNWQRAKNIQPHIQKRVGQVQKIITTVQDSIQEVTKPFAQAGGDVGKGSSGNEFADMFTPDKIFGQKGKKKSVEESFGSGF